MLSFILDKYLKIQCLEHMINTCLILQDAPEVYFLSGCTILRFHQQCKHPRCSTSSTALGMVGLFNFGFSNRNVVTSHIVLIYITLMGNDVKDPFK